MAGDSTALHVYNGAGAGLTCCGMQRCAECGYQQLCVWPVDADAADDAFECGSCGEMAAAFTVAHPLSSFPQLEAHALSRRAWDSLEGPGPVRES